MMQGLVKVVLLGDLEQRVEVLPERRSRGRDVAVVVNAGRQIFAVATDPYAGGIDVALPQLAEVRSPPGRVEFVAKLVPAFPWRVRTRNPDALAFHLELVAVDRDALRISKARGQDDEQEERECFNRSGPRNDGALLVGLSARAAVSPDQRRRA